MKRCIMRVFGIFILSFFTISQIYSDSINLNFDQISTIDGLSQSEVNSIFQDSYGFIWIGTRDGLNRYDGYEIVIYKHGNSDSTSVSNNLIKSIYEDSYGNLWVGTLNGINLYNKEKDSFTPYLIDNEGGSRNASTSINSISQRKNGDLLVGTSNGLFIVRDHDLSNGIMEFEKCLPYNIAFLMEDHEGYIWIARWAEIFKVQINNSAPHTIVQHYTSNILFSNSNSGAIRNIYQDGDKNLWIGTKNGLLMLPRSELQKANPEFNRNLIGKEHFLNNCDINYIGEDSKDRLIVATGEHGLVFAKRNNDEKASSPIAHIGNFPINNKHIKTFHEDATGVLWIGTLGGGCIKTDLSQKQFKNHLIEIENNSTISNFVRSIYEDENGKIWIGTLNGGLYTYNQHSKSYYKFPLTAGNLNKSQIYNSNAIHGGSVSCITPIDKNRLLIGSSGGLNLLNTKSGKMTHFLDDLQNKDSLSNNSVFNVERDDDGTFWVGTWNGLLRFIPAKDGTKGRFERFMYNENDLNSISDKTIRYVYNDPLNSDIWVGTFRGGLNRIVKNKGDSLKFIWYQSKGDDPESLSDNFVNMIYRSQKGDLWICTQHGLNKFIPHENSYRGKFEKYLIADGKNDTSIKSILEDEKGNLWLANNNGITRFNPENEVFTTFNTKDGILSDEFSEHACFKNSKGKMYFGGVKGFTSFYPDSIKLNERKPKVVFTKLTLADREVPVGELPDGRTILQQPVWDTDKIKLSHKDKYFFIEFSALHYVSPENNKYAYLIEGISDEWIYTDSRNRRVNFTNMKSGIYTLMVKASNSDGLWQETPISLQIEITPPFWDTLPAKFLYVLVILLIIFLIFKEFTIRERLKTKVALKNLEIKKTKELNDLKLRFFTNISHEFRTPLTLISTPLKNIINSMSDNDSHKKELEMMHKNSEYLLNLTNELIQFRKTESDAVKVQAGKNEIIKFLTEIYESFKTVTSNKGIQLELIKETDEAEIWFDKILMHKVLNNLIFNAFKFTPQGGKISIKVESGKQSSIQCKFPYAYTIHNKELSQDSACIFIRVIDTGLGISSESIGKIFERFYQVDSSDSQKHLGSGIGLALTKNLVLLNKGSIIVSSERNKGAEFIVCLPLGDGHFKPEERIVDEQHVPDSFSIELPSEAMHLKIQKDQNNKSQLVVKQDELETVLLVEDNVELRNFLKENLAKSYNILEADNGVIGLDMAIKHMPDLVVSDVMMPEMDGVELCAKLKQNIITSHIPLILLSALSSVQDQITGLETGADDYIAKPFDFELLETRIRNILQSRRMLRELFANDILSIDTQDFPYNSTDKEFLDKTIEFIRDNLSDPDFNVSILSKKMLLSRSHLLRKIKALTNQTLTDFIKTIRLKESIPLLETNKYSITEVSYMVGFSASSYFSTCFKKQFGLSPMEYLRKNGKTARY